MQFQVSSLHFPCAKRSAWFKPLNCLFICDTNPEVSENRWSVMRTCHSLWCSEPPLLPIEPLWTRHLVYSATVLWVLTHKAVVQSCKEWKRKLSLPFHQRITRTGALSSSRPSKHLLCWSDYLLTWFSLPLLCWWSICSICSSFQKTIIPHSDLSKAHWYLKMYDRIPPSTQSTISLSIALKSM